MCAYFFNVSYSRHTTRMLFAFSTNFLFLSLLVREPFLDAIAVRIKRELNGNQHRDHHRVVVVIVDNIVRGKSYIFFQSLRRSPRGSRASTCPTHVVSTRDDAPRKYVG